MKPTHFILNNEDLNFEVLFVGSERTCLKYCRSLSHGEAPYDYAVEHNMGNGAHRFDFYLGSIFVLPIGRDITQMQDTGGKDILGMMNIPGFVREEEEENPATGDTCQLHNICDCPGED